MSRILDLDALETVTVVIGGREFEIRPQRRALLQKILQEAFKDQEHDDKETLVEGMFKNWERQFPTFALIFGFEDPKAEETKEVLKHLQEHLTPRAALQVFQEWWAVNDVESFFLRAGMPMYPPNMVEGLKAQFQGTLTE